MDSQHRHELKENDLEGFFLHFGEFWEKRGKHISLVILVVVAGIAFWVMKSNRDWQAKENAWTQLENATTAIDSLQVAQQADNDDLRHQALLQAGDQWLASALAPADENVPSDQPLGYKEAKPIYEKIVATPTAKPIYKLNAMLGLACVAENQHDWSQADNLYTQVIALAKEHQLVAMGDLASLRQEGLTTLKQPVIFGKEPAKQPEKELLAQPQSLSGPAPDTATTPAKDEPNQASSDGPSNP